METRVREKPNGFAYLIEEGVSKWLHCPKAGPAYSTMLRLVRLKSISHIPREQIFFIFNKFKSITIIITKKNSQAHRFAEDLGVQDPAQRDALEILILQEYITSHFEFVW
jgi:hypothetical protein